MIKIISIIVVGLVAVWAFIMFNDSTSELALESSPSPVVTEMLTGTETPLVSTSPTAIPTSSPARTVSPTPAASTVTVTYTDNGYSPASVTIAAGGTVIFKNMSTRNLWTASNPHPVHTEYGGSGGCIGSIFDQCKAEAFGTSWSFKFIKAGIWGYHNHSQAAHRGTVVVK